MRFDFVKSGRVAAVLAAAAFAGAFATSSAHAELVGQLQCNIGPGAGQLITSKRPVSCTYRSASAPVQFYNGELGKIGLDVGNLASGTLTYDVVSIGTPSLGALQGSYIGAGAGVTLGTGIGVNALVGGNGQSITLQPIATTISTGTNINAGLTSLALNFAGTEGPRQRRRGIVARY